MSRDQSRRAARHLAISSNRSVYAAKKNEMRGAKSSTASPVDRARRTYSSPFANVKPSSCTAVAPASRMWYPEIEIGLKLIFAREVNRKMSATSHSDGSGG